MCKKYAFFYFWGENSDFWGEMSVFGVKVPFLGAKFGDVGANESEIGAKFPSSQGKCGEKQQIISL